MGVPVDTTTTEQIKPVHLVQHTHATPIDEGAKLEAAEKALNHICDETRSEKCDDCYTRMINAKVSSKCEIREYKKQFVF